MLISFNIHSRIISSASVIYMVLYQALVEEKDKVPAFWILYFGVKTLVDNMI